MRPSRNRRDFKMPDDFDTIWRRNALLRQSPAGDEVVQEVLCPVLAPLDFTPMAAAGNQWWWSLQAAFTVGRFCRIPSSRGAALLRQHPRHSVYHGEHSRKVPSQEAFCPARLGVTLRPDCGLLAVWRVRGLCRCLSGLTTSSASPLLARTHPSLSNGAKTVRPSSKRTMYGAVRLSPQPFSRHLRRITVPRNH